VLEGVRVLDLTRMLAGPYATMLLADLGAEVIKIEPPEGDDIRRTGPPFVNGESAYFMAVNRNKKSVVLDLADPRGRDAFDRLARTADVVIDNFRPGVMERLGIAHDRLESLNPRLVLCSITSFGDDGPMRDRPAFDLVIQAWAGAMSVTGEPGRPPVRLGIPLGDLAGGQHAALAIAAALVARERSGRGERISLTLLDCLASMTTYLAQYHFADGRVPGPQGSGHLSTVPYGAFRARDGWLVVGVFTERFWEGFCRAVDRPAWVADARFATNASRLEHRAALEEELGRLLAERGTDEWLSRLDAEGVPAAPVLTLDRTLALPQLAQRGMIEEFDHPRAGRVKTLASPIRPGPLRPPPLLGEHTADVLREVLSADEMRSLTDRGRRE
jgi:formyl-CoA transferase/CoA:oxalate CoA-transferase